MEVLVNNKKTIGIVAGVAAAAAGIYLLVKNALKEEVLSPEEQTLLEKSTLSQEQKESTVRGVQIKYDGENLSMATISQVVEATIRLVSPQFAILTMKDRKLRRAAKDDLQKYIELSEEYAENLDEIIYKAQVELMAGLGISEETWENSNVFYMNQGSRELMMLHASIPARLRMNMEGSKILPQDDFMNVMARQTDLLSEEGKLMDQIQAISAEPQKAIGIVQNRINDRIAEEFGVEEEDFLSSMAKYRDIPEVQQLFREFQQATMTLMPVTQRGGMF